MKNLVSILLFIIATLIPSSAQNNNRIPLMTKRIGSSFKYLSGRGGIRILSPHDDLIAEITFGKATRAIVPQRISDGKYEYIIPIDISESPEVKIVVTRKGASTASGTITEKQLQANYVVEYEVLSYENPIFLNEIGEGLFPSEDEVLIEVSSIFDLNIDVPSKTLWIDSEKNTDSDKTVYKIHVPLKYLMNIISQHEALNELNDRIERLQKDCEMNDDIDLIAVQPQINSMLEDAFRLSEKIRSMSRISLSAEKSNPQYIEIDGMQRKTFRKYGVEPLGNRKAKGPKSYDPSFKVYVGAGLNPMLQMSPTVDFGFDYKHLNVWLSASHSLNLSKELYVYNNANEQLGSHKYSYLRLGLNVGYELEPWEKILFSVMPQAEIAWDQVYSSEKDISGNGFNAYKFVAGARLAFKTNNRHWCFFATPEFNFNLGSKPNNNYDNITRSISGLKKSFDVQVGVLYYF